jgi:hypothetical protein
MECGLLLVFVARSIAMLKMIFFLWVVPAALAIIPLARAANGSQPIRLQERRLLFGKSQQSKLSGWIWLGFALLAFGFFALGVAQAVILLNLSVFWAAIVPFFTGAVAVLLLGLLLRAGTSRPRSQSRRSVSLARRLDELFFRGRS